MKVKKILSLALLVMLAAVIYCNVRISSYAAGLLYDSPDEVPHCHAALVLGTSNRGRNGGPNRFFEARIDACAELYDAGKIDRIIVSGDNRFIYYNEPERMREALVRKGIPTDIIFLDYAGFRTFDSIVRAKEVFGQDSFVVISQRFHNERAVFIAGKKGMDVIGYNAGGVGLNYGFMTYVRECLARCKVFLDLLTGKKPHFLGDPVEIG